MKIVMLLVCAVLTLQAGFFGNDERQEQLQKLDLVQRFKENAAAANDIVKRGEYKLIPDQEQQIARIREEVAGLNISEQERTALASDLETYAKMVSGIGGTLKRTAPELHQHYEQVIAGLPEFNRRMGSIGLRELLHSWRELSRIKGRFVKRPDAKLVKAFEKEWTNISVTITELYLDEEMEQPLFDYLEAYKAYFNELSGAYRSVGYAEVGKLKPLTYKIKMQFEMMLPRLAEKN